MLRCTMLLAVFVAATARADEAILPDGRRLEGKLNADDGRVTFQTTERSLPLAQFALVRFYGTEVAPVRSGPFRVALADGSAFAAGLIALDETRLRVQTSWANELTLPRSAVVSLAYSEGLTTAGGADFDPAHDQVRLDNGDQLFGKVPAADRDAVTLRVRMVERKLAWRDVRGVCFARQTLEPQTTDGEHVRLWLRGAGGTDELEGVLRSLDERQATLSHPILGELKLNRALLVRVRGQFHGRRIEIDNAAHHLADADHLSATLVPRRAEGTSLRRTVRLTGVPTAARLRLDVSEFRTDGEGRLELRFNDQPVADLTKLLDRGVKEPRRLDLEIPARFLQGGVNELELRLTPLRDSQRHPSCGVSRLVLELPR